MHLPGFRSVRENSGCTPRTGDKQATVTSLPLGSASEYIRGRSSDSAGSNLLAGLPGSSRSQCHLGLSYLLTAAGQFRIFTGFPFHPEPGAQSTTNEDYPILCFSPAQAPYVEPVWKSPNCLVGTLLSFAIGCDFNLVAADVHAAPAARPLLAGV